MPGNVTITMPVAGVPECVSIDFNPGDAVFIEQLGMGYHHDGRFIRPISRREFDAIIAERNTRGTPCPTPVPQIGRDSDETP